MKGAEVWTSKDNNFVEDWEDVFGRREGVKTVTFLVGNINRGGSTRDSFRFFF